MVRSCTQSALLHGTRSPQSLCTLAIQVVAAIVTCDGLCPGTNDVVQNIVFTLVEYGEVRQHTVKQFVQHAVLHITHM